MQLEEPQVNYCVEGTHDRIRKEVRDDIRARLEGPVRALHRWDCGRPASEFNEPLAEIVRVLALAAISSSSATETDGMTHRELLAYKAGELAGRQAERLGVSATEPQDGERPGLDVAALADVLSEWWYDPNEPREVVGGIDAEKAAAFIADAYRDYFESGR